MSKCSFCGLQWPCVCQRLEPESSAPTAPVADEDLAKEYAEKYSRKFWNPQSEQVEYIDCKIDSERAALWGIAKGRELERKDLEHRLETLGDQSEFDSRQIYAKDAQIAELEAKLAGRTDLDTKSGVPFSAASEHLYQKKIAELARKLGEACAENQRYREALEKIGDPSGWCRGEEPYEVRLAQEALSPGEGKV